ncbi:hypothetical protein F0562_010617 [Nyssa sinensis]|uniref:Uncharacterized protein n=1 Tax=Nyssa sinensis TaxID=561372 RepID=A0A5J5A1X3_9ASTE|nr:hypothetical protein F0562_010617 [Nyssa sinensis]
MVDVPYCGIQGLDCCCNIDRHFASVSSRSGCYCSRRSIRLVSCGEVVTGKERIAARRNGSDGFKAVVSTPVPHSIQEHLHKLQPLDCKLLAATPTCPGLKATEMKSDRIPNPRICRGAVYAGAIFTGRARARASGAVALHGTEVQ